jgi:alkanesulfonate monooxygenase SsuD/methylene tetrahydromethanopterin reductase-like flavin-dependent oxidoreductase (luciferase family)
VTPVAWIAALTSRIHVGTGIMQLAGRTPAATAMTAMTLDGLSGGRLGLGVTGPQVVEGWHGQAFGRPRGLRHHADGRGGRKAEAAVPDALVGEVALCGPRERIRELVGEWRASGVTTLMVAGDRTAARTMAEISS